MNYLENLEPSLLINNPNTFRVAYQLPLSGVWYTHECDIWEAWYLVSTLTKLERSFRILDTLTGRVFSSRARPDILNLFSIRLSDRTP